MKRLILAGFILVIVVAIYLFSLFYITSSCNKASLLLENSTKAYKTNHTASNETQKLQNYWDKREKTLSIFVNHDQIDEIEKAISLLNIYSQDRNNILFFEYSDNVKILLHQILEDTKLTMHSIF